MTLTLYNTLKRKEEPFEPLKKGEVKMYVCGPTVYDVLHVGNFRGVIFFNLVRNWLECLGFKVSYVYNYTDIDDKIINRAKEEKSTPEAVSKKYIAEFEKDFAALKLKAHDYNPKATEFIEKMVEAINVLVDKNKAYVIDGEVFYSVDSFKNYGKLSNKNLEELQAGHRIEVDPRKKNPLDFVLWKSSSEEEPGWDSPWGRGRPGWHIECSVMAKTLLGDSIDIHGGGIDLIFPHHENEIAQSEGASDKPFARYWIHNNFINFGDTKMSKSLGNVIKARDFLERYNVEIFKYLMLSVHYRSPLNLADTQIQQAIAALARIYSAIAIAEEMIGSDQVQATLDSEFKKVMDEADTALIEAMNDDFNTPAVLAQIFNVVRIFNAALSKNLKASAELKAQSHVFLDWIKKYGALMSLFEEPAGDFLKNLDQILIDEKGLNPDEINKLIEERNAARKTKDFKRSDQIRNQLAEMGIILQDAPEGTTWEVKKG